GLAVVHSRAQVVEERRLVDARVALHHRLAEELGRDSSPMRSGRIVKKDIAPAAVDDLQPFTHRPDGRRDLSVAQRHVANITGSGPPTKDGYLISLRMNWPVRDFERSQGRMRAAPVGAHR